jgi:hypothetical protein
MRSFSEENAPGLNAMMEKAKIREQNFRKDPGY